MATLSELYPLPGPKKIEFREDLPINIRVALFTLLRQALASVGESALRLQGSPGWSNSILLAIIQRRFNPFGTDTLPQATVPVAVLRDEDHPEVIAAKRVFVSCPWHWLYYIVEDVSEHVGEIEADQNYWSSPRVHPNAAEFRKAINHFFTYHGIGWQLNESNKIMWRGDAPFEHTLSTAIATTKQHGKPTAGDHLRFALDGLSARPKANTSGAVSHATNAVECVLGEITGQSTTLGDYLKRNPGLFHSALQKGLHGIYGYASDEGARHGKEGTEPALEEAEFVVATCAAVCTLLLRKHST